MERRPQATRFIQRLRRQPQAYDGDVHHGNVFSPKLVIYSYTITQNKMRGTRLNTGFHRILAVKDGIIPNSHVIVKKGVNENRPH